MATRSPLRKIVIVLVGLLLFLGGGLALAVIAFSKPLPGGEAGPEADRLARLVEASVRKDAWDRTQAVAFTFGGRNQHLWDRRRSYDRVRFGNVEVLVDLSQRKGVAFEKGVRQTGSREAKLVEKAYAAFINDSFWLNPLAKLFDDGVVRKRVPRDGQADLLVSYTSGGLTPGDSYLWLLGPDGRPRGWELYVSIIPLKGLMFTFEGWTPLSTGALVSTEHRALGIPLRLTDVAGAATLAELVPGPDPFALLQAEKAR
jgi:hypothetical protein